ncbi:uncharacterized protein LOC110431962 isoform X2 [Sorghum bicolor]|uniref:uncharacterized protein LOC110431962 isoform X2 n=1 Tax=Sorghum bicolor TaxID=4558 RepID=UPI000B423A6E|nr:uncharacterized protein LOC110431962 isoform X2 [Sorghum bicolor]|eukprot:XP_021307506.1 uncharacterized protein LOC110431962 isoform X2 [Sorghum bicolor]
MAASFSFPLSATIWFCHYTSKLITGIQCIMPQATEQSCSTSWMPPWHALLFSRTSSPILSIVNRFAVHHQCWTPSSSSLATTNHDACL